MSRKVILIPKATRANVDVTCRACLLRKGGFLIAAFLNISTLFRLCDWFSRC